MARLCISAVSRMCDCFLTPLCFSPIVTPGLVYRSKSLTPSRNYIPLQNALYAPTKLVQHWYTRAIAAEDE
ncbi:hypothetical protein BJX65DRAFT_284901 [Aspergillus insuetus]